MASTNWDTDRKRRRPPAWDPPKLLLVVVSGLHVVVGTSDVVGVVVDGGVWLLGSNVWLRHPRRRGKRGKRGSKATVSTHPKYSQARSYTTYAWAYV